MSTYLADLFSTSNRVALVTGGSSGIGFAMARAVGRAGAAVVLLARDQQRLDASRHQLEAHGVRAATVSADLADRDGVPRACEEAEDRFGEIDILITAAAVNLRPPFGELTTDGWDLTMAVNVDAPYLLGRRFGPRMAARGWGRIVNIASQQAYRAFGNSGGYGVSKAAILGLTRSQAEAWSRAGVCCNSVVPGFVHTPLTAQVDAGTSRRYAARTMIGRNGEPPDFEGIAVYLASRASDAVTAQVFHVDGGFAST